MKRLLAIVAFSVWLGGCATNYAEPTQPGVSQDASGMPTNQASQNTPVRRPNVGVGIGLGRFGGHGFGGLGIGLGF